MTDKNDCFEKQYIVKQIGLWGPLFETRQSTNYSYWDPPRYSSVISE